MKRLKDLFLVYDKIVVILALIAGITAVYYASLSVDFQFDDLLSIVYNRRLHSLSGFADLHYWLNPNNRALGYFTFALNYQAGQLNPTGYHVVNMVLHLLTSYMVYAFSLLLLNLKAPEGYSDNRKKMLAFVAAVIFALHPVQTMAVTYVVQRLTLLVSLFYLTSAFCYVKARMAMIENKGKKARYYFGFAFLSFVLGILSKQNIFTLVPMLLMIEWMVFVKPGEKTPMWLKFSFFGGLMMITALLATGLMPAETSSISRTDYLLTQAVVLIEYIKLIFWPLNLNIDHFIAVQHTLFNVAVIGGLILFLLMAGLAIFMRNGRFRLTGISILWFFIALSVESSLIPISDVMFEHRLYLPLAGLITGIVFGVDALWGKGRNFMPLLLFAVLAGLAVVTYQRNLVWQDEYALWSDSMKQYPDNPRAVNNVGLALKKRGNIEQALEFYNKALALKPDMVEALYNKGLVYFDQGNYPLAIEQFDRVLAQSPKKIDVLGFRGVSYGHLKNYDKALADLDAYIAVDSLSGAIFMNRGILFSMANKQQEAVRDFTKAMKLDPTNTALLINRSQSYYLMGMMKAAYDDIVAAKAAGHSTDQRYINDLNALLNGAEPKGNQ
ncbi:MAG: tetratricopeptide repeat protein [Bacteroidetes bacterium]|nr:tetratricopeptide repeat protein [Bacteroidota bacterium]